MSEVVVSFTFPDHDSDEVVRLRAQIEALEKLRPHWAQGWTDDGVAAQVSCSALTAIWDFLGVKNQTDAMAKLRSLM